MSNIIILINLVIAISGLVTADSSCGDWASYQDEKCFKVFDTLTTFSGAAEVCQKEGATIGFIRSAEEQGLVVKILKGQSIVDNVWIGIKKNGKSFESLDGNALKYTNWANNRPLNQTDVDCVELSGEDQDKWVDVKCEKKNAVLCEKGQQWSLIKIENVLQQIRKSYSERIDSLEKEMDNLKQNPVPIGFIYVQLSGQSEPHTLWPQTEWSNVSKNYSGLFFRAEGGNSAKFGQTQDQLTRSLQILNGEYNPQGCEAKQFTKVPHIVTNTYNKLGLCTGSGYDRITFAINLKYTTDENRPRNQAMRIWIRIK